jgi:hypothetical protein
MKEAEIRRIMIPGQSKQKSLQDPHLNRKIKSWVWWCTPVIPAMGSIYRRIAVLAALGKK